MPQNKDILDLINFFIYFYDKSKYKNYSIIYNFIENVNLNVNKFKFSENNVSPEEAYQQILKYLKEDFIIIRSETMNSEKEKKKQTIWDFDENVIETRQTMIGPSPFNSMGLKINDNMDKNDINSYNEKVNKNSDRQKLLSYFNTNKGEDYDNKMMKKRKKLIIVDQEVGPYLYLQKKFKKKKEKKIKIIKIMKMIMIMKLIF